MDKYKFIATREEYENFCLEVLGLFAVIMSRVDSAHSIDFENIRYRDLYDVYNRWKFGEISTAFSWDLEKFSYYNSGKSINQFSPVSIKKHIESLRDPFLKAHEGVIDLNWFHNSPAVLDFKKRLFEDLNFNDIMGTVDCWVEYFTLKLSAYYSYSSRAIGAPDEPKTSVRTLEKFISGWETLDDTLPYRVFLYYECVELNVKINYHIDCSYARFIPSKYVRFGQIMHRILTKEETKEFTRKDKYKLIFSIITPMIGTKDEMKLRLALGHFPFGSSEAAEVFHQNGEHWYRGSTHSEDFEKAAAIVYANPQKEYKYYSPEISCFIGMDDEAYEEYMETGLYKYVLQTLAHEAFLEYYNSGDDTEFAVSALKFYEEDNSL